MPRGRPRKPRLSRMDAAVDAMTPFGFSPVETRKAVKQLLKEYGGDEGWPFIEEYSYKELIDAILRNVEENAAEGGNLLMDKPFEDERTEGTSSRVLETQQDIKPENNVLDVAITSGVLTECTSLMIQDEAGKHDITTEGIEGTSTVDSDAKHAEGPENNVASDIAITPAVITESTSLMIHKEVGKNDITTEGTEGTSTIVSGPENNVSSEVAITDAVVTESTPQMIHNAGKSDITTEGGKGWKDILPYQILEHTEKLTAEIMPKVEEEPRTETNPERNSGIPASPPRTNILSPPPPNISIPPRRRLPCYGWIESDEETSDDFIRLRAAPAPSKVKARTNPHPDYDRKRKSK